MGPGGIIAIISFFTLCIAGWIIDAKDKKKKKVLDAASAEARKKAEQERLRQYQMAEDELCCKFGQYIQKIRVRWKPSSIDECIYVFSDAKLMLVNGKEIPFSSIIRAELSDDQNTITTTTGGAAKTEVNLLDAMGKADAARFIYGRRSAEYLAAQEATKVTFEPTKTTTIVQHRYSVTIFLKELANPCVNVTFGGIKDEATKLIGVIDAILAGNEGTAS